LRQWWRPCKRELKDEMVALAKWVIWKEKSAGRREKSLGIDSNESPLDHHAAAPHAAAAPPCAV